MRRVYIAGPYTRGDVAINVRNAIDAADRLLDYGCSPYVPHLTHFWHMMIPHPYETWIRLDLNWLATCHAVIRLPGASLSADRETAEASRLGIPVYESVQALIDADFA